MDSNENQYRIKMAKIHICSLDLKSGFRCNLSIRLVSRYIRLAMVRGFSKDRHHLCTLDENFMAVLDGKFLIVSYEKVKAI